MLTARRPASQDASRVRAIGHAATRALHDELVLSPKPGLVTLTDNGSHDDMDAGTFLRSIAALRGYFPDICRLGFEGAPFIELQACGIEAEAAMSRATGGINTHRGAIFTLGLLCAAAGAVVARDARLDAEAIRGMLFDRWGNALAARAEQAPTLPGSRAAHRHNLRSASAEASLGFPVLFDVAWPALRRGLARDVPTESARVDTLFHVIAALDDTNLAHRGGLAGLRFAQREAALFLDQGGFAAVGGPERAQAVGRAFVARRLSPGGAADMLAAACWLQRVVE